MSKGGKVTKRAMRQRVFRAVSAPMLSRIDKVPVTRRALLQRIARKLAREKGQMIRAERTPQAPSARYFIVAGGRVVGTLEDPEELGRELGVLQPWEILRGGK